MKSIPSPQEQLKDKGRSRRFLGGSCNIAMYTYILELQVPRVVEPTTHRVMKEQDEQ